MKSVLLSLLLLPSLAAQEDAVLSLSLENGDSMRAQVLELEGDKAKLRVLVLGGSMQVTRPLSDFTPASAFHIEEAAAHPDSFDAHFALAKMAGDRRLLGPAGAHARAAVEAVAGTTDAEAKTAEVRGWAADELEEWTREAVQSGELRDAKHYLKLLSTRLADQRSEEQLDALAAQVDGLEDQLDARRESERQAKLDAKQREAIDRRLKPIKQRIEAGDKLYRQAVAKSRNTSQSSNLAERAIEAYKSAWQGMQDLQKSFPDDAGLAQEVVAIGARLQNSAIRAALHAANVLTVQSDYKNAMEWCDKILAFDPDNSEAKEMKRTIQIAAAAASSQWGWGWTVVGGPGDWRRRR